MKNEKIANDEEIKISLNEEEITEFPQQDSFNQEDMFIVGEEGDLNVSNENE